MIRRLLVAGLVAAVVAAGAGAFVVLRPGTDAREVVIPIGATTDQIGVLLEKEGVIASDYFFAWATWLRRMEGRIQAGRYELRRGMGLLAALGAISRGPAEKGTGVTIPEGFALRQIAERVGRTTHIAADAFMTASTNGSIRAAIQPATVGSLEGFLFPETYFVSQQETADSLARRMVREFERRTAAVDWSHATSLGLSRYQALVIASLVEREARVPEDRPKVAAVIYNRLARGMRLQIDITALYDLDAHKVPSRADLRRPSPYNTYLIDGLPPTPIANPGLEAIEAALEPAPTDALYYVVIDPSGRHGFTKSPEEFERLKRQRPREVRGE